jgi:hypothetical protein
MFPYQRSYFISTLTDKLTHWYSPAAKTEFYPNTDIKPAFGIQLIENGYYYLSDTYVSYNDLTNGLIVRLNKHSNESKNWECFIELSKSENFKTDIPVYRDIVSTADFGMYEYAEIKSPHSQYGENLYDTIFNNTIETFEVVTDKYLDKEWNPPLQSSEILESTKAILESYIEPFQQLVVAIAEIDSKYQSGYPEFELSIIKSLYKDTVGFFWSDIDQLSWNNKITQTMFVNQALTDLWITGAFVRDCGLLTDDMLAEIHEKARTTWLMI